MTMSTLNHLLKTRKADVLVSLCDPCLGKGVVEHDFGNGEVIPLECENCSGTGKIGTGKICTEVRKRKERIVEKKQKIGRKFGPELRPAVGQEVVAIKAHSLNWDIGREGKIEEIKTEKRRTKIWIRFKVPTTHHDFDLGKGKKIWVNAKSIDRFWALAPEKAKQVPSTVNEMQASEAGRTLNSQMDHDVLDGSISTESSHCTSNQWKEGDRVKVIKDCIDDKGSALEIGLQGGIEVKTWNSLFILFENGKKVWVDDNQWINLSNVSHMQRSRKKRKAPTVPKKFRFDEEKWTVPEKRVCTPTPAPHASPIPSPVSADGFNDLITDVQEGRRCAACTEKAEGLHDGNRVCEGCTMKLFGASLVESSNSPVIAKGYSKLEMTEKHKIKKLDNVKAAGDSEEKTDELYEDLTQPWVNKLFYVGKGLGFEYNAKCRVTFVVKHSSSWFNGIRVGWRIKSVVHNRCRDGVLVSSKREAQQMIDQAKNINQHVFHIMFATHQDHTTSTS